jgi:hypothetical protein
VPFAAGSAPVVKTFATLSAETSRLRLAAFIPDTAIAEMLLISLWSLIGRRRRRHYTHEAT